MTPTEKQIEAAMKVSETFDLFQRRNGTYHRCSLSNDEVIALSAALAVEAGTGRQDGNRPLPFDRDTLGRFVREAWVRWAETQPNPKPSWLVPYEELSDADQEADRQIGEAVARWTFIGDAAISALTTSPASSGVGVKIDEEALDRAAREGYAVRCKTHGPRTLAEYASRDIMDRQLADARVIVAAYLSAPSLSAGAGGEE